MYKERLLTPGPTAIPGEILQAMSIPQLHHRSEVFKKELRNACEGVKWVLGWNSDPVFLASSGTGALEATLLNTCSVGDEIIYVNGGTFGARWGAIADRLGLVAHEIKVEWGLGVTPAQVLDACRAHPTAKALCLTHSETSTTVLHPLNEVIPFVRSEFPHLLTIVDAISASVTAPPPGSPDLIDAYVAGSQKAYMLPPGLSFVVLSERAWKVVEGTKKRTLYFDFLFERKAIAAGETKWTPASTLIVGLNAAIALIKKEGLEEVYTRHALLSKITRIGLQSLGCKILAPEHPSPSVTGFMLPDGMTEDADAVRTDIRKKFGVRLAGGQEQWKGKVIRVGHMGHVDPFEVVNAVTAIGLTLKSKGLSVDPGNAVAQMIKEL